MQSGIYQITCMTNGRFYIGSAKNIDKRWKEHKRDLRLQRHKSSHLMRAWAKYGEENFRFEVLEYSNIEELILREQFYLDLLKPFGVKGFNTCTVAGSTLGIKLSAEHRKKISERGKGRKHSLETIAKMREIRLKNNPQKGRPLTEKQKIALFKKGKDHPWFGRKHSAEVLNRFSDIRSVPIVQILPDGTEKYWSKPKEAAKYLGLRSPDSIYRAVNNPKVKSAGCYWKRP